MTISNLLDATAKKVSARRQPRRRSDGNTAKGTMIGTRTSNNVKTTVRTINSHHKRKQPTTTPSAKRKSPKPGVDGLRLAMALANVDSCCTAVLAALVDNWLTALKTSVVIGRARKSANTHAGATPK